MMVGISKSGRDLLTLARVVGGGVGVLSSWGEGGVCSILGSIFGSGFGGMGGESGTATLGLGDGAGGASGLIFGGVYLPLLEEDLLAADLVEEGFEGGGEDCDLEVADGGVTEEREADAGGGCE